MFLCVWNRKWKIKRQTTTITHNSKCKQKQFDFTRSSHNVNSRRTNEKKEQNKNELRIRGTTAQAPRRKIDDEAVAGVAASALYMFICPLCVSEESAWKRINRNVRRTSADHTICDSIVPSSSQRYFLFRIKHLVFRIFSVLNSTRHLGLGVSVKCNER